MKTSKLLLLFIALTPLAAPAQVGNSPALGNQSGTVASSLPTPTAYRVVARGPDQRVWQRETYEFGPQGKVQPRTTRFTELSTGLHYWQNGQWNESKELIEIQPDGTAAATQGRLQVRFPGNINQGVIHAILPGGQQLKSRPLGLSYDDGTKTVLLARLKDSTGELVGSNQVVYADCFVGLKADLRYRYKKGKFEQDVILNARPPAPETFGLNPATTRLQVLTEFFNPPNPEIKLHRAKDGAGPTDNTLRFGKNIMGRGRAFLFGDEPRRDLPSAQDLPVYKSWEKVQGRTILIEEIPLTRAEAALQTLPQTGGLFKSDPDSKLCKASDTRWLPPAHAITEGTNRIQLAKTDLKTTPGFVMDYVLSNTFESGDLTLHGDTTYFISGGVEVVGTLTIEGGTVVKYDSYEHAGGMSIIVCWGQVVCATAPYRPAVFTYWGDTSVGQDLGMYGPPDYAYQTLYINDDTTPLANLRISYAGYALHDHSLILRDSQIVNCMYGIICDWWGWTGDYTCCLTNVLMANVQIPLLSDWGSTWSGCNVTIAGCQQLCQDLYYGTCTMNFVNSLLVGVTNNGGAIVTTNYTASPADTSIFQVTGAGSYYLATDSPYRQAGTTNIDPETLASLAGKTTYPPVVYSNLSFTVPTNFGPQVPRNATGQPDLGYHYDALDYAFGGVDAYSNVTFSPGTAVGYFELPGSGGPGYGISIFDHVVLAFNGTATSPCTLARYSTVQEGGNGLWTDKGWLAGIAARSLSGGYEMNPDDAAQVRPNFTRHFVLTTDSNHYRELDALIKIVGQNSEFWNGSEGGYWAYINFTNCLFDRSGMGIAGSDWAICGLRNCTMRGGEIDLFKYNQTWSVWIEDCAFDGTKFLVDDNSWGDTNITYCDFNAFTTNTARLPMKGTHDVTNLLSFNWQTSWLGNYYLLADSPLIDAGSTTADRVGLYEFTTQANQTEEATSPIDIGYHYVAVDANGNPVATFTNGTPDYIEDANGNGLPDWWEWHWFGNYNHTGSELDANGNTLLFDYQNGVDPTENQYRVEFKFKCPEPFVNNRNFSGEIIELDGQPSMIAVAKFPADSFSGTRDFSGAEWSNYSGNSSIPISLPDQDGNYEIWVGLKSSGQGATPTWHCACVLLDSAAPELQFDTTGSYALPSDVTTKNFTVRGNVSDTLAKVQYKINNGSLIDGIVVASDFDVSGATPMASIFECRNFALSPGNNTITFYATDRAGNQSAVSKTIGYTPPPPASPQPLSLTICWPPQNAHIAGSLVISGQVNDPNAVVVVTGDGFQPITAGMDGVNFYANDIPMKEGVNTFTVKATTPNGPAASAQVTVERSPHGVGYSILPHNHIGPEKTFDVAGSCDEPASSLFVNGIGATISPDGYFWQAIGVNQNSACSPSIIINAAFTAGGPALQLGEDPTFNPTIFPRHSLQFRQIKTDKAGIYSTLTASDCYFTKDQGGRLDRWDWDTAGLAWSLWYPHAAKVFGQVEFVGTYSDDGKLSSMTGSGYDQSWDSVLINMKARLASLYGQLGWDYSNANQDEYPYKYYGYSVPTDWLAHGSYHGNTLKSIFSGGRRGEGNHQLLLFSMSAREVWFDGYMETPPYRYLDAVNFTLFGNQLSIDPNDSHVGYVVRDFRKFDEQDATALVKNSDWYWADVSFSKIDFGIVGDANMDGTIADDNSDDVPKDHSPFGILVSLNDNDSDQDGLPDNQDATINGYDDVADLKEIKLHASGFPDAILQSYSFRLRLTDADGGAADQIVRIFDSSDPQTAVPILGPGVTTYSLPQTGSGVTAQTLMSQGISLWAEGITPGGGVKVKFELLGPNGVVTEDAVQLRVIHVDLDVDSDNNNGLNPPDRSAYEETIEADQTKPGKILWVHNDDADDDGIPDYADGFNLDLTNSVDDVITADDHFVPMVLELNPILNLQNGRIQITYNSSDPAGITYDEDSDPQWTLPGGNLRIWSRDSNVARNMNSANGLDAQSNPVTPGDYVAPGLYTPAQLGLSSGNQTVTLYLEGIAKTSSDEIKVEYIPDTSENPICVDAVRVTVIDPKLEYVTLDPDTGQEIPVDRVEFHSDPRPEVDMHFVGSPYVDNQGNLVVTVNGTVTDRLSDLAPAAQQVQQLKFSCNGVDIGTINNLPAQAAANGSSWPWQPGIFSVPFQKTFTFSYAGGRPFVIHAETSANAAGDTGWSEVSVSGSWQVVSPFYPGTSDLSDCSGSVLSSDASPLTMAFNSAMTSAQIYFGNRAPQAGDPTITGSSGGTYTGHLQVCPTNLVAVTVTISSGFSYTNDVINAFSAQVDYTVGTNAFSFTGVWQETVANTHRFYHSAFSSVAAAPGYMVLGSDSDITFYAPIVEESDEEGGGIPGEYHPKLIRVTGIDSSYASAFTVNVNGTDCPLVTLPAHPNEYYIANPNQPNYPQLFVDNLNISLSGVTPPGLTLDQEIPNSPDFIIKLKMANVLPPPSANPNATAARSQYGNQSMDIRTGRYTVLNKGNRLPSHPPVAAGLFTKDQLLACYDWYVNYMMVGQVPPCGSGFTCADYYGRLKERWSDKSGNTIDVANLGKPGAKLDPLGPLLKTKITIDNANESVWGGVLQLQEALDCKAAKNNMAWQFNDELDDWQWEQKWRSIPTDVAVYAKYGAELEFALYTTIIEPAQIATDVQQLYEHNILVPLRFAGKLGGVTKYFAVPSGKAYLRPISRTWATVTLEDLKKLRVYGMLAKPTKASGRVKDSILKDMKNIQTQFGSSKAVFYSGGPKDGDWWEGKYGPNMRDAVAFAKANSGQTIEMTPGGQWLLNQLSPAGAFKAAKLSEKDIGDLWKEASKYFGKYASGGTAYCFVEGTGEASTQLTVFWNVEITELLKNTFASIAFMKVTQ